MTRKSSDNQMIMNLGNVRLHIFLHVLHIIALLHHHHWRASHHSRDVLCDYLYSDGSTESLVMNIIALYSAKIHKYEETRRA